MIVLRYNQNIGRLTLITLEERLHRIVMYNAQNGVENTPTWSVCASDYIRVCLQWKYTCTTEKSINAKRPGGYFTQLGELPRRILVAFQIRSLKWIENSSMEYGVDSRFAPSQWETSPQSNVIFNWSTTPLQSLFSLQWRHNERDSVINHMRLYCLLNRWFRRRSEKTSKLRVTRLWGRNSPHRRSVTRKIFPFHDVIMLFGVLYSSYDAQGPISN